MSVPTLNVQKQTRNVTPRTYLPVGGSRIPLKGLRGLRFDQLLPRFVRPYLPASHTQPVPPSFRSGPGPPPSSRWGPASFSHPSIPLSPVEFVHHLCGVVYYGTPPPRVHRIIPLHAQDPNPCDQVLVFSRAPLGARSCHFALPHVPWGSAEALRRAISYRGDTRGGATNHEVAPERYSSRISTDYLSSARHTTPYFEGAN